MLELRQSCLATAHSDVARWIVVDKHSIVVAVCYQNGRKYTVKILHFYSVATSSAVQLSPSLFEPPATDATETTATVWRTSNTPPCQCRWNCFCLFWAAVQILPLFKASVAWQSKFPRPGYTKKLYHRKSNRSVPYLVVFIQLFYNENRLAMQSYRGNRIWKLFTQSWKYYNTHIVNPSGKANRVIWRLLSELQLNRWILDSKTDQYWRNNLSYRRSSGSGNG